MDADSSCRSPRDSRRRPRSREKKKVPYFADVVRERDRVRNLSHRRSQTKRTPTPPRAHRSRHERERPKSRSPSAHRRHSRSYDRRRNRRSCSHNKIASTSSSSRRRRSRSRSRTPRIITVPVPVPAADYAYAYGWPPHHPPRQHFNPMFGPLPFAMHSRPPNPYFMPYPRHAPPYMYRGRGAARPFQLHSRFSYRNVRQPPN